MTNVDRMKGEWDCISPFFKRCFVDVSPFLLIFLAIKAISNQVFNPFIHSGPIEESFHVSKCFI